MTPCPQCHLVGTTSSTPPGLQDIDRNNLGWWSQRQYTDAKTNNKVRAKDHKDLNNVGTKATSTITLYMEDENGEPISEGTKNTLRKDLYAYWNGLHQKGER